MIEKHPPSQSNGPDSAAKRRPKGKPLNKCSDASSGDHVVVVWSRVADRDTQDWSFYSELVKYSVISNAVVCLSYWTLN